MPIAKFLLCLLLLLSFKLILSVPSKNFALANSKKWRAFGKIMVLPDQDDRIIINCYIFI